MKSLKEQLAELEDPAPPKEIDPEVDDVFASAGGSESDIESDDNEFDGREHYEEVGKSRLRKPAQTVLGKRYAGASVSRSALDNGEEDDSQSSGDDDDDEELDDEDGEEDELALDGEIGEDSEIDSDEAFGSGDEERFKDYTFRGSKKTRKDQDAGISGEEENSEYDSESEDLEEDMDDLDVDDNDEEDGGSASEDDISDKDEDDLNDGGDGEESEESEVAPSKPAASSDRAALRALMSSDTKVVASTISAAAAADAQKGLAVKEQNQTFEKLVDLRIKLQKSVTTSNSLPSGQIEDEEVLSTVRKAEEAALQLWSTLESLRHDFLDAQEPLKATPNPKKRKRPTAPTTPSTPLSTLWARTQTLESHSLPHRRLILDKWSTKVRASTTNEPRARLMNLTTSSSVNHNNITSVIDAYLATHPTTPSLTYDDTPFYQSLLLSLISSRSTSAFNPTANLSASTILPLSRPKNHRPNLDTKASKGRKLRFTPHEKLMNFMAPETIGNTRWGDRQIEEFFGSLFGGRKVLDEDERDEEDEGGDEEEEGLRLFR